MTGAALQCVGESAHQIQGSQLRLKRTLCAIEHGGSFVAVRSLCVEKETLRRGVEWQRVHRLGAVPSLEVEPHLFSGVGFAAETVLFEHGIDEI